MKSFILILDTGSYILWVAKVGSKGQHKSNNLYEPSDTKTSDSFKQKYGFGVCSGDYYTDNLNILMLRNSK